jgi:hypothetical protein
VECQLLLFETQTKACPPEVLAALREELKNRTLGWSAVRAEMNLKEIHQTDLYITKLYEILAKGGTFHQPFNRYISTFANNVQKSIFVMFQNLQVEQL